MAKQKQNAVKPKTGLHRGTTGYAINYFRSDILVNLQLDLKRLERAGIKDDICTKIQQLLSALVTAASAEPRGSFWQPAVHTVFREYERIYKEWNDVKGEDERAIQKRDALLKELQDVRHKIANVCRQNSYSLSQEHDLQLVDSINEALRDTINAVPGTFTALSRSAQRFAQRAILPA